MVTEITDMLKNNDRFTIFDFNFFPRIEYVSWANFFKGTAAPVACCAASFLLTTLSMWVFWSFFNNVFGFFVKDCVTLQKLCVSNSQSFFFFHPIHLIFSSNITYWGLGLKQMTETRKRHVMGETIVMAIIVFIVSPDSAKMFYILFIFSSISASSAVSSKTSLSFTIVLKIFPMQFSSCLLEYLNVLCSKARPCPHPTEDQGGEASGADHPLGHHQQHGVCSPKEDHQVRKPGCWDPGKWL